MTDLSNQIFPRPTAPTPSLPDEPTLVTLDSFKVGELSLEQQIEIVDSIMSLSVNLTANGVSSINFAVFDPEFRMHDNNYFLIQRVVEFNGMLYEIASVEVKHAERDTVSVTARNFKMQEIRREIGNYSWGAISPTELARLTAVKHGLGFVGETSAVKGTISRVYNDKKKESTYDILQRLARELEFMFYEAKDYLFFASQDLIASIQGQVRIFIPGRDAEIDPVTGGYVTDIIFPLSAALRRDENNDRKPATFNVNAHTNATSQQLYPGLGASFLKVVKRFENNQLITAYEEPFHNFPDLFFIDKVNYNMTPNSPTVFSGTSIAPTADMICSLEEYKEGDKGVCVERIQQAVGMTGADITGIFDAATTTEVTKFQQANILRYSDTRQFSGDNWKEYVTLGTVGPVTWSWIKAVNMSEVTVAIPPVRAQDADDEITSRGFNE